MPELPEVETVRRTLAPKVVGRIVRKVDLRRADVLRRGNLALVGKDRRIEELLRHGKQLAIVFEGGGLVLVHLGMSGQLFALPPGVAPPRPDHLHARWLLEDGSAVWFRDPRRFGGLWTYPSTEELHAERWSLLGPDALAISHAALRNRASKSRRAVKACLLDQTVLAGVGNIYADEALFAAGLHPERPCDGLSDEEWKALAACVRRALRAGIRAGGSSLRDFLDAELRRGSHQTRFRVYGRGGFPCKTCGSTLETLQVAQRTSTYCRSCQPL